VFSKGPTLKFRLSWTTEPSNGLVDRPKPLRPQDHSLDSSSNKENRPGKLASNVCVCVCVRVCVGGG
jgi:polycomb protein SUZ12